MSGDTSPRSIPSTLTPLPPAPRPSKPGYLWASILVASVLVVSLVVVGFGWYTIPGLDAVRASGWYFATAVLIVVPAHLMILIMSWGLLAVFRKMGARTLPGVVQAVPAVLLVLALVYLVVRILFAGPDEG
jgi:hypothetical protein